ncbi:hypothetical protein [Stenotrophomonas nematodicola]|uniref:SWIM-type domain-containing protein n=1 Tax=Stenotrophomonas nematodicola TaxID=2656746 RepID=A0ABW7D2L8_9GAMM
MNLRQDLLELTPAALMALANPGFVKRAQKDLAAGMAPALDIDASGTLTATYDDGCLTRLPVGCALRDAQCSCTATAMCRHRVTLVLAWQAQVAATLPPPATDLALDHGQAASDAAWSPAQFDLPSLAAVLPPGVMDQAERLRQDGPVITVSPWAGAASPPGAQLPMCSVRFFARGSIAHARCDCRQGGNCAHVVLAVMAFAQAERLGPLQAPHTLQLRTADAAPDAASGWDTAAQALQADIDALLLSLWLDGGAQPLIAVAARIQALRTRAQVQGWCWIDDTLAELRQLLQARQARSTRFAPLALLDLVVGLWARLQAAAQLARQVAPALPAAQVLGIGVKGEVALDRVRLVSLGAALWGDEREQGATVLWADPDTQSVTVMARQWPREAQAPLPLGERRIAGHPLRQLAASQVVTQRATRSANGTVSVAAQRQHTGLLPLSPRAWDELGAPLRQPDPAALAAHLAGQPPAFTQPRLAAAGVAGGAPAAFHVVQVDALQPARVDWDPITQTLHADLVARDGQGIGLRLLHPHRAAAPDAVDVLARVLDGHYGALRAVAGNVCLQGGALVMQPTALLTDTQAVVPQVHPPVAALPLRSVAAAASTPLLDTLEHLSLLLQQGLRHQHGGDWERVQDQAHCLRLAGYRQAAAQLGQLRAALVPARRPTLLQHVSALAVLVRDLSA